MFRKTQRLPLLATAIAVVALAVPATSGAVDYRNPDSKGAAIEAQQEGSVDLRSPDARDAGQPAQTPSPASDVAASSVAGDSGFDWGDAGIGAGSVLGLTLIALSVMFAMVHRRRGREDGPGGPALTA